LELAGCVLGVRLGNAGASAYKIRRTLITASFGYPHHPQFQKPLSQIEWERFKISLNKKSGETFPQIKTQLMYPHGFGRLMILKRASYGGTVQTSNGKAKTIGLKSLFLCQTMLQKKK
jgi:hypothetical protein